MVMGMTRQQNEGLYEIRREHDACGIGAVVNIAGEKDHSILEYGKEILLNLHHRGAASADEMTGDGAGSLGYFRQVFCHALTWRMEPPWSPRISPMRPVAGPGRL